MVAGIAARLVDEFGAFFRAVDRDNEGQCRRHAGPVSPSAAIHGAPGLNVFGYAPSPGSMMSAMRGPCTFSTMLA